MLLTGSFGVVAFQDSFITSLQTDIAKSSSTQDSLPASFVSPPPAHTEIGNIVIDIAVGDTAMNDLGSVACRATFRVSILETAASCLVWSKHHSRDCSGKTDEEYLFEDLEPAVPKILTY